MRFSTSSSVESPSSMASVAHLSRWFIFSLISLSHLPSLALAGSSLIKTKTVTYCSDPTAIVVEKFGVRYSKENSTLDFDLSATSITKGLNLGAQFNLNSYGIHGLNSSIDLCSVLSGILCPLPTYNFTGSGQYAIPTSRVPSITSLAWTVPDIEAVFTIELIDNSTNLSAACLQATLTNGLTVGLSSVVWASASFLILAALIALVGAVVAPSSPSLTTPGSFFYLLGNQLQNMAMAGMLSLNYPVVLRTWTTNFAYSFGLISSSSISRAIDNLRDRTGGNGFHTAQNNAALISRLYSPYNQEPGTVDTHTITSSSARSFAVETMKQLLSTVTPTTTPYMRNATTDTQANRATTLSSSSITSASSFNVDNSVPIVTRNTTLIDPGLAAYINQVGFPVENAFMFLFMWLLILIAFFLSCLLLASIVLLIIPSSKRRNSTSILEKLRFLRPVGLAVGLRGLLFAYPPLSLFTFWQWRLGHSDAWVPILFSVFLWFGISFVLAFIAWKLVRHYCNHEVWEWSTTLVGLFKPGRWWLMGPFTFISLLRMAFIGFGQGAGQTQVISEMALFLIQLGLLAFYRPFGAKLTNVAAIIQSSMGLIQSILLQLLVPSLNIKPIPRAVVGFVMIAVHSIGFITVIIFGAWPLIGELKNTFSRNRGDRMSISGAGLEKDQRNKEEDPNNPVPTTNRNTLTNFHDDNDDDGTSDISSSRTRNNQPVNNNSLTTDTDDHLLFKNHH